MFNRWRLILRLFPYMRPYKGLAGALVLLTALAAVFALFEPWPLAFLIDSVLGDKAFPSFLGFLDDRGPAAQILFSVLLGFTFILVSQGLTVLTRAVDTRLELGMVLDFRSALFSHIQKLSFQYHDQTAAGRFIYQINYFAHDAGSIPTSLLPMAQALLTLVGMFFITYRLEPQLALAATVVVPFVYSATTFYGKRIEPELFRVRGLEGRSMSIVHEKLSILRVVVSFCRERYEHTRFRAQAKEALDARVHITIMQTLFSLGVALITAAGTALVLFIGARAVQGGDLSVGELLVVLSYVAAVYQPLEQISQSLAGLQQQLIQMDAVFEVLDAEPEVTQKPDAVHLAESTGRIELNEVSFHYHTRTRTLGQISLVVEPGEFVAIVGPTGAGKSTLVSLIPRFFDPQEGRVMIDGHDVRDLTLESLRGSISVVMQEPILFKGTIAENIRYGRLDATDDEVISAAQAANAHHFIEQLPDGYQTTVGERGTRISGGERQRIAVARAFLKDAPVLILDEPTSSIDSRTEAVILDALERLAAGRTTIMIAHRLSTIRMASRIFVMDDGGLVEQGTHGELLALDGLYASLWRAQTGGTGPPGPPEGTVALPPGGETSTGQGVSPVRATPLESPSDFATPDTVMTGAPAPFEVVRRPKVVVLGMMSKIPVAGVVWQTMHYLVGLERLGVEAYYVEAHARTPSMLMERERDDSSARAADFIGDVMHRFGFDGRWAFHALHDNGAVHGMSPNELQRLYAEADLIINLHGGTEPLPEHAATGRLIYLETDPVQLQIELHENQRATTDFLEPHVAFFTFGENYGQADCGLPVSDRFQFLPTRQPVVCDFWAPHGQGPARSFTTIGNWRQQWRDVTFKGEIYHWTKHLEFLKFIELPRRVPERFELALSSCSDDDRKLLESHGWHVSDGLDVSLGLDAYRSFIGASRGEFTVAKDQNVRLRTGWFSDRSATYLAAGRPVVTQDTGFGNILPTGEGLFSFTTTDEVVAALTEISGDYQRHCRRALAIAREYFSHGAVLRPMLDAVGLSVARGRTARAPSDDRSDAFPAELDLSVVGRHPTTLTPHTLASVLGAPLPPAECGSGATTPTASIVVVTHDNLVFTRLCLESVIANTARSDVEIIVVDNASVDMTDAYLERLAGQSACVRYLRNEENLGFAVAVNQGLTAARGDVLVVLNNDTVVAPGWIDRLEGHLRDPAVGMVGPLTNCCPNEACIEVPYTTYGGFLRFAAERATIDAGQSFDIDMLTMFCVAFRRDAYERVGPLDERFEVGMFEDDDFALRVRGAGLRVVCAADVVVHHFGEASLGKLVSTGEHGRIFQANKRRFESKWARSWDGHRSRPDAQYERLVATVREAIMAVVPEGETVLVVSKGDDELLDVDGRGAWHFPQQDDGAYAGWYPANTREVTEHLGRLAGKGASYIVFPETAAWWFEFYEGLEDGFAQEFEEIGTEPSCRIFTIRQPASAAGSAGQ